MPGIIARWINRKQANENVEEVWRCIKSRRCLTALANSKPVLEDYPVKLECELSGINKPSPSE